MTGIARWACVALDCPDAERLAAFYGAITGWPAERTDVDWIELRPPGGGPHIALQQVADHVAPSWPGGSHPQQAHLDFDVHDLRIAEAAVIALGAHRAEVQPRPGEWLVMIDPAGHPFCLIQAG
jgi:catechol 2,3-dioxygenase-like lactoylglutathione lyase family enzyme